MDKLFDKLFDSGNLTNQELNSVIDAQNAQHLFELADKKRREYYDNKIFVRGLIEISNYCKNNCYYCGIRRDNKCISRYHLSADEIMDCVNSGYTIGFRTFVLQGGEDLSYSDKDICRIIDLIKTSYPDCAVTLSIGEKSYESYKAYKNAGADRYLLRHETANPIHYSRLHPSEMTLQTRKQCLWDLKELGYQVGSGFMVGSPYQTKENLIEDLRFLQELDPDMIGIGPFIPHCDTPFKNEKKGALELCINMIAIARLMFPHALIPATTALATIDATGRERGILAGANVVMPNLSPENVRSLYKLYNNKAISGCEAAEEKEQLIKSMKNIGYEVVCDVGHVNRKKINL